MTKEYGTSGTALAHSQVFVDYLANLEQARAPSVIGSNPVVTQTVSSTSTPVEQIVKKREGEAWSAVVANEDGQEELQASVEEVLVVQEELELNR